MEIIIDKYILNKRVDSLGLADKHYKRESIEGGD